jgi:hypothetical protein
MKNVTMRKSNRSLKYRRNKLPKNIKAEVSEMKMNT